jgi:phosphoserine phosphatase RsbU/P
VAVSDGVVEAMNEQGDQFGNDRLQAELQRSNTIPVEGGVERLLGIVERWTGQKGPQDDISIVALSISNE